MKEHVEQLLMIYMDGTFQGFEHGYIPDLFDVEPLRDDIIKLIQRNMKVPRCADNDYCKCNKCELVKECWK